MTRTAAMADERPPRDDRPRRRWRRAASGIAAGGLAAGALWMAFVLPRVPLKRSTWTTDHLVLARAAFEGDSAVTLLQMRDFAYANDGSPIARRSDARFSLDRLTSVWFVLTPFSTTFRGPAHAFLSFGFNDGRYVAVSVEARREEGEAYSLVGGMVRRFELAYIVGSERDLIGRRALHDGDDVYLYPIATTPERARRLFREMLERANAVQDQPEFYHTLWNNCTTNIVEHVNRLVPGRIPPSFRVLLPGYADALALSLGLIRGESVDSVRARYRVNDRARAAAPDDDFSMAIRRGITNGNDAPRTAQRP
jgi:Domain of unknown function (DUF4105)